MLFFTLLGTLLRLIWFRLPEPEGLELRRGAAPRLFSLVDRLAGNLNTPPIHSIVIDLGFNAGVTQIPRLGLLGWHKNNLVVGLPLLFALTPDQFRAILAHELGHIAGSDGRFELWMASLHLMWAGLLDSLAEPDDDGESHPGMSVLVPFLNWFTPVFFAHLFALRRADEYHADQFAKRFAGGPLFAESLVAVITRGEYLGDVLAPQSEQAARAGQTPLFTGIAAGFRQGCRKRR